MKILIISDAWHPQINGVVRTYENIGDGMTALGHDVTVIGPADFPLRMSMPGYSEIKLVIKPYARLKKMITQINPDKIHIPTEGPLGRAARKYCIKHDHPFSTSFHTLFPDYLAKRIAKFIPALYNFTHTHAVNSIRRFHEPAAVTMVATPSLENTLQQWGFNGPFHRVTRGAQIDMFTLGEKTKFENLKPPIALYVGRIAIEKNIEAFLDMDWHGTKVIVGDGPARDELEKKYPDTHFAGIHTGDDLAAHYRSADVFVFPSKTDTFGMVLVEALACGLPIAAYDVTGPKDIVTKNYLGALTADDLGAAAKTALTCGTPEQRAQHVYDHYTWDIAAKQYEDALLNKVGTSEPKTIETKPKAA